MKVIEQLEDDDPDVFQTGILDRYSLRPQTLSNLCLADFAARYTYASKPLQADIQPSDTSEDEIVDDSQLPATIQLGKHLGHMRLRKTAAIIRSHQFSETSQPEQYYHAQLLLYYPWRHEMEDLLETTYHESYTSKLDEVKKNRVKFEEHSDQVDEAVDCLHVFGAPADGWAALVANAEQNRADEQLEGSHPDEDSVFNAPDTIADRQASRDLGLISHVYELSQETLTNQQWYDMVLSLNHKQTQLHRFIVHWCTDMILSHRTQRPDPFHIFLTGGAGVGKSHLVRTIVQTVTRLFNRNNQSQDTHIMVCAPTGAAAYNIAGHTLHAAFLLPLNPGKYDDYIPLSSQKLASVKESIGNLKILVIDEISMVGSDMLLTVHRRLCDIMGKDDLFGGVSVLAVGDLLQLPPVRQRPVFSTPTDEMAALYGSLWQSHFEIMELTDIVRQKNDQTFASLLNRVRCQEHTAADLDLLKSRQITPEAVPKDITHIFTYNKFVNAHNSAILDTFPGPFFTFTAVDSKRDSQTGRVETASFPDRSGGLQKELKLTFGTRVMLTTNVDVSDGLVNSAAGTITGFLPPPPEDDTAGYKPKYIPILFNDECVGHKMRQTHKALLSDNTSTPVPMVEAQIRLGKYSKVTGTRRQFPLTLAWGVTIHKEQGKTEDKLVISCAGSFQPGQFYTAISRTKTLDGLFILGEVTESKIRANQKSLEEINRMRKQSMFKLSTPTALACNTDVFFKLSFLNANSLAAHLTSLQKDNCPVPFHVFCIAETWLLSRDITPELPNCYSVRRDRSVVHTSRRSGGLIMFIHYDFLLVREYHVPDISTEHLAVLVSPRWSPDIRICLLVLYKNPRTTATQFLPDLETVLSQLPIHSMPTFVTGDVNIDYLSTQKSAGDLENLMKYYGFVQLVTKPTHRKGGLLDHFYSNVISDDIVTDTFPVYYSDHLQVATAVPFPCLHHF